MGDSMSARWKAFVDRVSVATFVVAWTLMLARVGPAILSEWQSLALLSGVPALLYEVVWAREVALLAGSQVEVISAVLVAFFGGLALGAALLGNVADRTAAPLRLYARLEAAAAGLAALSPIWLWSLDTPSLEGSFRSPLPRSPWHPSASCPVAPCRPSPAARDASSAPSRSTLDAWSPRTTMPLPRNAFSVPQKRDPPPGRCARTGRSCGGPRKGGA